MRLIPLFLAAFFVGCDGPDKDTGDTDDTDTDLPAADADGDGYTTETGDCDDDNAAVYPGADEVWYDGVDQDCDGKNDYDKDEDGVEQDADCDDEDPDLAAGLAAYLDADADGYGTGESVGEYCELPAGTASNADDCDDTNGAISPAGEEVCDGVDNDCDDTVDVGASDGRTVYTDADADGFGDPATVLTVCGDATGTVEDGTDCDDTDALTYPGAEEVCDTKDNDCDAEIDEGTPDARTYYADADGDGYGDPAVTAEACGAPAGYVEAGTDCNDADATLSPGAVELCDGIDNDCDAEVDTDSPDALSLYVDADSDGYGDPATLVSSCEALSGYVTDGTDCDDTNAATSPAATELCDAVDNNCDGATDESTAADAPTWYIDADEDGYGDPSASATSCEQPTGFAATDDDCDDANGTVSPAATEVCDEVDNDCDGTVDDGASAGTWYADADSDGYGDAGTTEEACEAPAGYVADDRDCDDADGAINPAATEVCDEVDNDCDGSADGTDAVDVATFYADADSDGYGDAAVATTACDAPASTVTNDDDCDDGAASTYPGAAEVCDDADQDCDGTADEGATDASAWYADADGDGYGDASSSSLACDAPANTVADATDCDDGAATAYPGATEACDDLDNDCDGATDEAGATGEATWYVDDDGDGYGVADATMDACDAPAGYAATDDDCDDEDTSANPGESEAADTVDNDCDGWVDEDFVSAGDVIITEIARQPRVGGTATNTNAAWFELYNTTSSDIYLSNWYVQRSSSAVAADGFYVDPADEVVVPADDYVVFCKTDDYAAETTSASDLVCDYYWADQTAASTSTGTYYDNTFNMQRDEDTLSIWIGGNASSGTQVDAVAWTYDATDGYWPREASRSMQLDLGTYDGTDNDSIDNWCAVTNNVYFEWYYVSSSIREFGTPGLDNHTCP